MSTSLYLVLNAAAAQYAAARLVSEGIGFSIEPRDSKNSGLEYCLLVDKKHHAVVDGFCSNDKYVILSDDRDSILKCAADLVEPELKAGDFTVFNTIEAAKKFCQFSISQRQHEIFSVLYLDNRHRLIEYRELFRGTVDGAMVYPREIVKEVLELNATSVIFVHNHPSGDLNPSQSDIHITERLSKALKLFDVKVLDHFIVGPKGITSFSERGLL